MSPAAKIGLFMLAGLIVLAGFVLKIEDIPLGGRGAVREVRAELASAAGIDRNAPVRIAGVRVGSVKEIRLAGGRAELVLALDPGVELHQGATAQITSLGMLGDRYVEVVPGDPAAPPLAAGATLSGVASPSFDDVLEVAGGIGVDLKEVSAALRTGMGGEAGGVKIEEIVDNLRQLTADLARLIRDNQANVNATTANFRDVSATLKVELPRLADKVNQLADQLGEVVAENRDDARASLANIRDLTDRLRTTADNLNTITGRIAAGEGSLGKLVNDSATVDNLNRTLETIDKGVKSLDETMGRYRRYHLEATVRGEALPSVSESRTAFGFDLWTTDARFFRLEGVDTPFGRTRTTTETVTTTTEDGSTATLTQVKTKTEDKLRLSAQVGYRLLPRTTVRAGLFEGSGGFAFDQTFDLAERPLRLSLEAWDVGRDEDDAPHLRLEGRYFLSPNLFLSAGWDDPTYSDHSSYLLGAGVSWSDEDIKYNLGLAGAAIR